jgi:hypothetical protein
MTEVREGGYVPFLLEFKKENNMEDTDDNPRGEDSQAHAIATMIESERKNNIRYELLKMVRELVNEEYINKRADAHNKWVAENTLAKLEKRLPVPYPTFVTYPTYADILAKAAELNKFVELGVGQPNPVEKETLVNAFKRYTGH